MSSDVISVAAGTDAHVGCPTPLSRCRRMLVCKKACGICVILAKLRRHLRDLFGVKVAFTMKHPFTVFIVLLAAALGLNGCATSPKQLANWPAGSDPRAVGLKVADNLLLRDFRTNKTGMIVYPEICAGFGALRFAAAAGDPQLERQLFDRYAPILRPGNEKLIPHSGHVDSSVFGVVPLEIFLLNGDTNFLAVGLQKADQQWENPLTNGLTRETRWWVDDAFMVGSLQIQDIARPNN
jgi:unsaturated rhamnogalacturonyl hydrolase